LSAFSFVSYFCGPTRVLHSFPTRRSSDLITHIAAADDAGLAVRGEGLVVHASVEPGQVGEKPQPFRRAKDEGVEQPDFDQRMLRSEEHTSELQSRENLVCRLLLEKKKKQK